MAKVGGFSTHVWTGDESDFVFVLSEVCVVGNEGLFEAHALHYWVTTGHNFEDGVFGEDGARVVSAEGRASERKQHIQFGKRGGVLFDFANMFERFLANVLENFVLQGFCFFLGSQDFFLIFFKLRCDETFGIHQGLFANVSVGDFGEVGVAHFDEISKYAIESDFQRVDSGGRNFFFLDGFERGFCVLHEAVKFVEAGVETGLD